MAFERLGRCGVKVPMDRVRIMLVWLLPALCVAAGQGVPKSASGYPTGSLCTSLSASRHRGHSRLPDVCAIERLARQFNRRAGTQLGAGGLPVPVPGSEVQPCTIRSIFFSAFSPNESLALAQCWQFRWRTALEPRAPSSVS